MELSDLIEETAHYDKDNRYMAISDIMKKLDHAEKMSVQSENLLCEAIVKLLEDKETEVKSMAVKCISKLTCRVSSEKVLFNVIFNGFSALKCV